jgi:hypothetical protein
MQDRFVAEQLSSRRILRKRIQERFYSPENDAAKIGLTIASASALSIERTARFIDASSNTHV